MRDYIEKVNGETVYFRKENISWKTFFEFGQEGGFWDLLYFLFQVFIVVAVFQVFLYGNAYVIADMMLKSLNKLTPEIQHAVIEQLQKDNDVI